MTQQLFIPEKIKVGFQEREGTYTGKLAYVIYFDQKGKLRKEKSWESWRDSEIDPIEFENQPTSGFVLNKKTGGYSTGWNHRNTYVRVYDPRDFEFEISVPNLLFILQQCDCSKGKGLEGDFVYSWEGTELVLLPSSSEDYKASKKYTNLQSQNVKAKELIPGASYLTKNMETLTYLGKFNYYYIAAPGYYKREISKKYEKGFSKKFVFWGKNEWSKKEDFKFYDNIRHLADLQSSEIHSEYANLVDKYNKSPFGSKPIELVLKPSTEDHKKSRDKWRQYLPHWYQEYKGKILTCRHNTVYEEGSYKPIDDYHSYEYFYMDGSVIKKSLDQFRFFKEIQIHSSLKYFNDYKYRHNYNYYNYYNDYYDTHEVPWEEPKYQKLFVKLENGKEYPVNELVTQS